MYEGTKSEIDEKWLLAVGRSGCAEIAQSDYYLDKTLMDKDVGSVVRAQVEEMVYTLKCSTEGE